MSKDVEFKRYFLDGKEVHKMDIDWRQSSSISIKGDDVYIKYWDKQDSSTVIKKEVPEFKWVQSMTDKWIDALVGDTTIEFIKDPTKGYSTRLKSATECPNGVIGDKISIFSDGNVGMAYTNPATKLVINPTVKTTPRPSTCVNIFGDAYSIPTSSADELLRGFNPLQKAYNETTSPEHTERILKECGVKEEDGKLDYELDWEFLTQMAERMSTNKGKYPPYNWKKPMNVEKLKQAMFRHMLDVMNGNYEDDGRLYGHLEAISLNSMMINYQLRNK